jgi:hypothetical protein
MLYEFFNSGMGLPIHNPKAIFECAISRREIVNGRTQANTDKIKIKIIGVHLWIKTLLSVHY